ncbi:MAG TPA: VWA domain-containing protein, partial [Polyangia bacterium]|nr:VWA domain-containing protein [Polyangia bacterium]
GSVATTKRELAAELACVLALSAVRNNDKVGLLMFSDRIEAHLPPAKGRIHVMRVVREILTCRPTGVGTDIAAALDVVGHSALRRSVVFLLSDLEMPDDKGAALAALERAARPVGTRHDVVAFEIRDPHERALPALGLVTLEDAETGDVVMLDTGRKQVRERFTALAAKRDADTRRTLRRVHIETLPLETTRPYLPALLGFFESRKRRLA